MTPCPAVSSRGPNTSVIVAVSSGEVDKWVSARSYAEGKGTNVFTGLGREPAVGRQSYGTSYQGADEARSSCVTLLLLKSLVMNFHWEKINAPQLEDLMAEDVLCRR